MNYNQFRETVLSMIQERKEGASVSLSHVLKNNGVELDGLTVMTDSQSMAPTVYLDSFYTQYQEGASLEEIVERILKILDKNPPGDMKLSEDFFSSFESVKDKVVYKVVNYEQNKKLLAQVPHRKILDLALVFCCLVQIEEGGASTILIYSHHLERWGITAETLYETAIDNTPRLFCARLQDMEELLCCGSAAESADYPKMLVLTNNYGMYGAGAMFYDHLLSQIAESFQKDLLILPSSIHEVIIILKEEFEENADLKKMVGEMNDKGLSREEILSYNIYCYNQKSQTLGLA